MYVYMYMYVLDFELVAEDLKSPRQMAVMKIT